MKRVCLCLLLTAVTSAAWAELVDGVVATVGPEVILHSDLMEEIAPALNELRKTAADEESFNRAAEEQLRQALDQAVEGKILIREAMLAGLEVKDNVVEERIQEIKKRFSSNEEFQKEIERAGETMGDLRERVRKQILAISMAMQKRRDLEKECTVSEAEVAQYYEENKSEFTHPERVRIRRIFLTSGSDPKERVETKAKLEELKKQIDAGADFAELAKSYSNGPDAAEGGLVGWVSRNDLVPDLENAAFSLPEGGVSGVLETEFGAVLLKVEKKESAGTPSLIDARTDIEPKLRAKLADEKYRKWMDELRKRSRVRIFL